jgi:outer membrane protein OmpA-like peptidoglycan-associated protein
MNNRLSRSSLALAVVATAVLAGCASAPSSNAALDQARAVYSRASGDADTARSAPLELRSAQAALQQAESELKAGNDISAVEHYAYLARQKSETALQAGEIARAEKSVGSASAQRDQILMGARVRDAEKSAADAQKSRDQSEKDRQMAEDSRKLADQQLAAAEAAKAKVTKLQNELAALQAKQTDRGMVLTLGDVLFDTGRSELKSGAFSTIDRLATFMRENPERTLAIEGFTDSVGSDALNLNLSQRRAESVRAALVSRGLDGARISTQGLGKANPVAGNDTAAGRQRNRRVEIVISKS